jgi:23S rRNA (uracil1939-C5)-methyltransferase
LPEIAGVVAFRAHQPGERAAAQQEIFLSDGENSLTYETQRAAYRVSAGAFFQSNRHLTDELVNVVAQGESGELALDLYAGVGLFSAVLTGSFRKTVAVEAAKYSAADLKNNLSANHGGNGEAVQATAEQYLSRPGLSKPDLVVMDPPRTGLGDRVIRPLLNLGASRLTYVSCDPATLARDLIPLLAAGYRVEQAHLIDLFPQTYHLESVLHLAR